jgi:capsular polysaccharide transport system ATP-binding protein
MLVVRDLMKQYVTDGRTRTLFRDLSFDLPRDGRLAILGRNGQGKSTLLKILGGVLEPTAGDARWSMTASWPLGFGGAFQGGMTGLDNIRFLARIYRRSAKELIAGVEDFSQLGDSLRMPVRLYSSGMRARLAFGLSIAIEFDCYLIDEIIAVGDAAFSQKCEEELFGRRAHRAFILASHDMTFIKRTCTKALVVEAGRAKWFDSVDTAVDIYVSLCLEESARAEAHIESNLGFERHRF